MSEITDLYGLLMVLVVVLGMFVVYVVALKASPFWYKIVLGVAIVWLFVILVFAGSGRAAVILGSGEYGDEYNTYVITVYYDDPTAGLYGYGVSWNGETSGYHAANGFASVAGSESDWIAFAGFGGAPIPHDFWAGLPGPPPPPPPPPPGGDNTASLEVQVKSAKYRVEVLIGALMAGVFIAGWHYYV